MSLAAYHQKRDFQKTAEPEGTVRPQAPHTLQFVIQKHDASHLHYDFRLELDGVLKSWAVPQGPCLDPTQKRLAVQVEDHPLDYATFEGIIPAGQYGGGTVIVWDRGTWTPIGDPAAGLRTGKLKFSLAGEKLTGNWTLVRMRPKPNEKKSNWLLIKERDDAAVPLHERNIVEEAPASVASGRTIAEMAANPAGTWNSSKTDDQNSLPNKKKEIRRTTPAAAKRHPAKSRTKSKSGERMPSSVEPQLATLSEKIPDGPEWAHEIKLDGYRLLAFLRNGSAVLRSRNDQDWTHRFPELAQALARLHVDEAIIDGEAVALSSDGTTNFQELQEALSAGRTAPLCYYAFDLLWLNGLDLRERPLHERKSELREIIPLSTKGLLLFSDDLDQGGPELFANAKKLHLEGIVSKRRDQPYRSGRSTDWIKVKTSQRDEFVIGGYTDSPSARRGLGAILIGYFDDKQQLKYAGKVGSGFTDATNAELRERLIVREIESSPFDGSVPHSAKTHWVRPEIATQIAFTNWTRDGRLRHPVFQGIREDKPPESVIRDRPLTPKQQLPPKKAERSPTRSSPNKRPARREAERARGKTTARTAKSLPARTGAAASLAEDQIEELKGIHLTHPERIVYPSEGITKLDLVEFYAAIADWILPHIADRPLSLLRCPEGEGQTGFFQKHAGPGTPAALRQVEIREKEGTEPYSYVDSLAGLLSIVQIGALEIHPWGSRRDDVERPDRLIFDLDPDPSVPWKQVVAAARELRERLETLGLVSFLKTTGGKGLHVTVPIVRRTTWPEAKAFTRGVVSQMEADSPSLYTTTMRKAARHGRIFLDYLRNDRGATAVAPYSTRARAGAPVATPLDWKELGAAIRPDHFHVGNLRERLSRLRTDPWEEIGTLRQSLTARMRKSVEGRETDRRD